MARARELPLGELTGKDRGGGEVNHGWTLPLARLTEPPLTTVSQPTEQKGQLAARALLDALAAGEAPEATRTLLPAELVVRRTTGPPAPDDRGA